MGKVNVVLDKRPDQPGDNQEIDTMEYRGRGYGTPL
jgi:hypothetical protein